MFLVLLSASSTPPGREMLHHFVLSRPVKPWNLKGPARVDSASC